MRITSSTSAAPAAAVLLLACVATPASAFLPSSPPSVGGGDGGGRRSSCLRLRASSSSTTTSSLADQLSSLSYDGSFLGLGKKAASKISEVAARGVAEVAASSPSSASSSSSSSSSFPDPSGLVSGAVDAFGAATSSASSSFVSSYDAVLASIRYYESMVDSALSDSSLVGDAWTHVRDNFGPVFDAATTTILRLPHDVPPSVAILLASLLTYSAASTMLDFGREPPPASPYPMNKYDPVSARRYFDGKWSLVIGRATRIAFLSSAFLSGLAYDYLTGNLKANAQRRADGLSVLLAKLGPSFIKVGQSLSIRTDLLSPEYVRGLKALQDQCPPFDTADARRIIEEELGGTIRELFADFPPGPIAAASLGQVYRATIRAGGRGAGEVGGGGGEPRVVAVKVQRPGIVEQIALDMHLIREVAGPLKRVFNLNTDIVGVVDAWGEGFVDELDYVEEAVNAKSFAEGISRTPLSGVVFAPPVVDELTTRKVLTTEWVVGERLDRSAKEDVSVLCSIAMNSYLTMMLETGLLVSECAPRARACVSVCVLMFFLSPSLVIVKLSGNNHR